MILEEVCCLNICIFHFSCMEHIELICIYSFMNMILRYIHIQPSRTQITSEWKTCLHGQHLLNYCILKATKRISHTNKYYNLTWLSALYLSWPGGCLSPHSSLTHYRWSQKQHTPHTRDKTPPVSLYPHHLSSELSHLTLWLHSADLSIKHPIKTDVSWWDLLHSSSRASERWQKWCLLWSIKEPQSWIRLERASRNTKSRKSGNGENGDR